MGLNTWHCRGHTFKIGRIRRFKPVGLTDRAYAQQILDLISQALYSPFCSGDLCTIDSEECILLPVHCTSLFFPVKDTSTRRYSAIVFRKSRAKMLVVELHRMLLIWKEGPPVGPCQDALHRYNCLPGCINPSHLRWGTPKENAADRERKAAER